MYVQVVQPAPPPPSALCKLFKLGCPAPVVTNPDALASVLTGSPAMALQQPGAGLGDFVRMSRATQLRMFRPPLRTTRGMTGCSGGCKCGGKCGGMGDAAPLAFFPGTSAAAPPAASSPGFFQQLTDPFGSDVSVLTAQIDKLNQQTANAADAMGASNMGTWILVGLSGFGLWIFLKNLKGAASRAGERVKTRRLEKSKRAAKRARLRAELDAL